MGESVSPAGREIRFRRSERNATARTLRGAGLGDGNRWALDLAAVILADRKAWERRDRTLRIQKAHEAKRNAQDQEWYAGTRPYGWRSVGHGKLEAVELEQRVIDWMLRQREAGYGWANITERLNGPQGPPAPQGKAWHMSTVRRIVARGRGWQPPPSYAEVLERGPRR